LKARVGKVRCGQCQSVFNALDSLLDETPAPRIAPIVPPAPAMPPPAASGQADASAHTATPPTTHAATLLHEPSAAPDHAEPGDDDAATEPHDTDAPPLSEAYAQELGKATGLIMPRETTDIPGYSKWIEGVMSGPLSLPSEKATRWPFVLAALLLALALAGQLVFRFRGEIATTAPSLHPSLELFSHALNADLPLPRHVELVSIETSDLQTDPARGNLLVLNATLRNRANYGQAYPSLELSLTDTHDAAIARRVFAPGEYLPAKAAADQAFAAKSDIAVRLWIEATEINAAGYRLYVFYP
jgi:hypothetical protein